MIRVRTLGLSVLGLLVVGACQRVPEPPADPEFDTDGTGTTFLPGDDDGDTTEGADGESTAAELPDPAQCIEGRWLRAIEVTSPQDLAGVEHVTGTLSFSGLTAEDLTWMQCLRIVEDGSFAISDSPALTELDGLQALETIDEALYLQRNDALLSLDALSGLTSVGTLSIRSNASLTTVDALREVQVTDAIGVYANPLLSAATFDAVTHLLSLDIGGNDQLSALRIPGLVSVEGWADITRCPQLSVVELPSLEHADGLLLDRLDQLASVDDLSSLRDVTQFVRFREMPALESLSLPELEQTGQLEVTDAPVLQTIELPSLAALESLGLTGLPLLAQLPPLPPDVALESVGLQGLPQITNLDAIGSVRPDARWISLVDLPLLTDISALAGVQSVDDRLWLEDLPLLASLDAFSSLTSASTVELEGLPLLPSLAGLDALGSAFSLDLRGLSSVTSLSGLGSLTWVTARVTIEDNAQLTSLDGLDAIEQVSDRLQITDNPALTSIDALWPSPAGTLLAHALGQELVITGNGALSQCTVDAFVDALIAGRWVGMAETADNGPCP